MEPTTEPVGPKVFSCTAAKAGSCAVSFTTNIKDAFAPEVGIVANSEQLQMHGATAFSDTATFTEGVTVAGKLAVGAVADMEATVAALQETVMVQQEIIAVLNASVVDLEANVEQIKK